MHNLRETGVMVLLGSVGVVAMLWGAAMVHPGLVLLIAGVLALALAAGWDE